MDFGAALQALRAGQKVSRRGWNGKGMYLVYVPATENAQLRPGTPYAVALAPATHVTIDAHIDMFTAGGTMQPGWLASQADMQARDWEIVV